MNHIVLSIRKCLKNVAGS